MASPAFRSETHSYTDTNGITSYTPTEPTGAAQNDIITYLTMFDRTSGSNPGTVTAPAAAPNLITGFPIQASATWDVYAFWGRRGASASSYQISWQNALGGFKYVEALIVAVSGAVTTGSPIDASAVIAAASTASPDPPGVTTGTTDTLVLTFAASWAGWATGPAAPTGYTNLASNGGFFDFVGAYKAVAAAGAENPSTFGAASGVDQAAAFTIAIASLGGAVAVHNTGKSPTRQLLDGTMPHLRMSPRSEHAAQQFLRRQKRAFSFHASP